MMHRKDQCEGVDGTKRCSIWIKRGQHFCGFHASAAAAAAEIATKVAPKHPRIVFDCAEKPVEPKARKRTRWDADDAVGRCKKAALLEEKTNEKATGEEKEVVVQEDVGDKAAEQKEKKNDRPTAHDQPKARSPLPVPPPRPLTPPPPPPVLQSLSASTGATSHEENAAPFATSERSTALAGASNDAGAAVPLVPAAEASRAIFQRSTVVRPPPLERRAPIFVRTQGGAERSRQQRPLEPPKATLYVCGFPEDFRSQDLEDLFLEFGRVLSARVMRHVETSKSRGFGFVNFESREDALAAMRALDGRRIGASNRLVVKWARERQPRITPNLPPPPPLQPVENADVLPFDPTVRPPPQAPSSVLDVFDSCPLGYRFVTEPRVFRDVVQRAIDAANSGEEVTVAIDLQWSDHQAEIFVVGVRQTALIVDVKASDRRDEWKFAINRLLTNRRVVKIEYDFFEYPFLLLGNHLHGSFGEESTKAKINLLQLVESLEAEWSEERPDVSEIVDWRRLSAAAAAGQLKAVKREPLDENDEPPPLQFEQPNDSPAITFASVCNAFTCPPAGRNLGASDWRRRPLSGDQLAFAAQRVHSMLSVYDKCNQLADELNVDLSSWKLD